jgi:hypothetical protein
VGTEEEVASGIAALREARPEEYRPGDRETRRQFEAKLRMLTELEGDALLVPEAPVLGAVGHQIDGALYNLDTLKFFEALIALERGAVLDEIRTSGPKIVWEIGAGWGGFAYQFKTLFPDVTYVIVDLPERLPLATTYLETLLPEADFVFVPATASEVTQEMRPDLMLNVVPSQGIPTEHLDACARLAWELECPFAYSPNRDVRDVLSRYYWLYEVPLLEFKPPPLPERVARWGRSAVAPEPSSEHRHAVGWRRAST